MRSDHDRKSKPDTQAPDAPARKKDKSVGESLREVYREAVSEDVPDEMLDLLKKLG